MDREDFFNGKFKVGQIVEDDAGVYEILDIGSNYLTVIDETLKISKKWHDKINESSRDLKIDYFQSNNEFAKDIRHHFIELIYEYSLGKFNDKMAIISAWNKLNEVFINNNIENISKIEEIFSNINQEQKFKDIIEMYQKHTTVSSEDQLEAVKIFSSIFNEEINTDDLSMAIYNLSEKYFLSSDELNMLKSLKEDFNIDIDLSLIEKRQEDDTSDYIIGKDGRKHRAHKVEFTSEDTEVTDHLSPEPNYSDIEHVDTTPIDFSPELEDSLSFLSDFDLDHIIDTHLTDDDFYDEYPEDQLCVVDSETGEPVEKEISESQELNEVLSRMERMKASIRFHRTASKRERRLHIALMKKSDTKTIIHRARRLAVKALELKIARKPLNTLTVSEKERVETRIQKLKPVISRLTVRLISRVKQLEKQRLHEGF